MTKKYDKVEIGCGKKKRKGFFGIDIVSLPGVDLVANVEKEGIPLPDNVVEHLLFWHSFEHFSDLLFIVSEIWRVCKHYARVEVCAPYMTNVINLSNPYHKIHITEYTFLFFSDRSVSAFRYRLRGGTANEHPTVVLRQEKVEYKYFPAWENKTEQEKEVARQRHLNVVQDIHIWLRVVKKRNSDKVE